MPRRKRRRASHKSPALSARAHPPRRKSGPNRTVDENHRERQRRPETETSPSVTREPVSLPAGHHGVRAAIVSVLIGASVSTLTVGLGTRLEPLLGRQPTPGTTVVAVALLLVALGVRLPHQLALWMSIHAWRLFLRSGHPMDARVSPDRTPIDSRRNWMLLSVIVLGAGLSTAFTPLLAKGATALYWWLQDHFVWSLAPLVFLRVFVVFITAMVPLLGFGLAIATAHRITRHSGAWDTHASAWVLLGAALGLSLVFQLRLEERSPDLCLMVAALPALIGSLASVGSWSSRIIGPDACADPSHVDLPQWSDRWPTLLRASIVSVSAACVWVICFATPAGADRATGFLSIAAMLGSAGLGILLGGRSPRAKPRSIGGFGVVCALAGVLLALASTYVGRGQVRTLGVGGLVAICVGLGALGYAATYGRQALLVRVASRTSAGSVMLFRVLVGGALIVWVGAPITQRLIGARTAIAAAALFLLALAGLLMIYEPAMSARTRLIRVSAVFCAIAALIGIAMQDTSF